MEREALLATLAFLSCGTALVLLGILPAPAAELAGRAREPACWARLWWPLVPAAIGLAFLLGWALQEPDPADEFLHPTILVAAAPVAVVWVRAIVRAVRALLLRPELPASTSGLLRPRVTVSPRLAAALDDEALRAAIEHETAHARHRDPLRIWLGQVITDLQWPFPGARARFRAWLDALETARDDEARGRGVDGAALAAAVLAAARLTSASIGKAAPIALTGDGRALESRIDKLLHSLPAVPVPRATARLSLVLVPLILFAAAAAGVLFGEGVVRAIPGVGW